MAYALLEKWVNTNSGTRNSSGLRQMADLLLERLQSLDGELERISLPPLTELDGTVLQPGEALRLRFRPEAPVRVLFSGHMDTVFGVESPFQRLRDLGNHRVNGPGVADMKGGLYILVESVDRFLKEDKTGNLGGEILITADEEVGSPASHGILEEAAQWNHLGLVFESALPGGELVCSRKGTGTFRVTAQGKSAHSGRDFASGRNALAALADFLLQCHKLNDEIGNLILNVGRFKGGGPVNIVPDTAECWLNVRVGSADTVTRFNAALERVLDAVHARWDGVRLTCKGGFARPPKLESDGDAALHELWNTVEKELGLPASGKRATGGSSDGNIFSAVGLPQLDGIGIRGGALHSDEEFALLDSIPAQIDKTVGFLHLIASNPERIHQPPLRKST